MIILFRPISVFILLFIICISIPIYSQSDDSIRLSYSWSHRNFFQEYSIGVPIIGEFYWSPDTRVVNSPEDQYSSPDTTFKNTWGITMVSFSYEPRINILNYKDFASLSVNMPINVALSFDEEGNGFGHFNIPVLLHLNLFYHSTYNNINYKGFTIGAGVQYIRAPIYFNEPVEYDYSWFQPVVKAAFKYQSKTKDEGYSFGTLLGYWNGYYLKFSVGRILNY